MYQENRYSVAQDGYQPTGILLKAGFDQSDVETLRATAKAELLKGAVRVSEWESGDQRAKRFYQLSTMAIIEECAYALSVLDPDNNAAPIPRRIFARFG